MYNALKNKYWLQKNEIKKWIVKFFYKFVMEEFGFKTTHFARFWTNTRENILSKPLQMKYIFFQK